MTRRLSPSENYTQDQISQRQATMSRLSNMFDRAVFSVQFPNQCELFFFAVFCLSHLACCTNGSANMVEHVGQYVIKLTLVV